MKILICGDRNWNNKEIIDIVLKSAPKDSIIIEGEARGADTLSRVCAEKIGLDVMKFPADWGKYGRAAGPIRNREMLDQDPDIVIGFHDNIKLSKGTVDTLNESVRRGITTYLINGKGDVKIWKGLENDIILE